VDASVNRIKSSKDERAYLIGINLNQQNKEDLIYSLSELKLLVGTAGAIVVDSTIIRRDKINPAYIFGKGHLEKIKEFIEEKNIKLLVFDMNDLRPAQVRNLEDYLKCRVIGRNEVILDIFARRAKSAEAKIQVELAQLRYILPRLKGLGGVLSRLGGGIGTRGPGEKMLETDKRHILKKITKLKKQLQKYEAHRGRTRSARKNEILGAVVGYTNAGKSTLINFLAKDDLFVENRLFATLDSYTRSVYLEDGKNVLLTDTVGFIRNLPANLIESFRSTLEDIKNADFIIHVVDVNSLNLKKNIQTVHAELEEMESLHKPTIVFFNKTDLLDKEKLLLIQGQFPHDIFGSIKNKKGIVDLKEKILDIHKKLSEVL